MKFEEELKKLNPRQLEAVQAIEGPVLVIAGPGSGKTQLLSMRVANILRETDALGENILCLTFTNKAAVNMAQRLEKLVGRDARSVEIKTFHAFAGDIIASYPEFFWSGANFVSASDIIQRDILTGILSDLPRDNYFGRIFDGRLMALSEVAEMIKLSKEAGLTPGKLRAIISHNLAFIEQIEDDLVEVIPDRLSHKALEDIAQEIEAAIPNQDIPDDISPLVSFDQVLTESLKKAVDRDLPTGKTKHTGQWKRDNIQTVDGKKQLFKHRQANNRWLDFSNIYEKYQDRLHSQGYYDYSDMILEVVVQLENNPDLLAEIQERYSYVLIDEFQDSTPAQIRLAHLVSNHHLAEGRPNIMAVGDDDQSIYGFNGAELNNMMHFDRAYQDTKFIVLEDNYRSSQSVLDFAKTVIEQSDQRLINQIPDLTKNLVAALNNNDSPRVEHLSYVDQNQQNIAIVKDVAAYRERNPDSSIAVLARNNYSLSLIAEQFHNQKVPINYELSQNILDLDPIKLIMNIARLVSAIASADQPNINSLLYQVLSHPVIGLQTSTVWSLLIQNRYDADYLSSIKSNTNTHELYSWLIWLAKQSHQASGAFIIEKIVGLSDSDIDGTVYRSPVSAYLNKPQDPERILDYLSTLSALRTLRSQVEESTKSSQPDLDSFLHYVDSNQLSGKGIYTTEQINGSSGAVELLTVHKSKGLEFDRVYIIDSIDDLWRPTKRSGNNIVNLPLKKNLETIDDYIRLMYVAITRARNDVIVSSYKYRAGSEVMPTRLIQSLPIKEVEQNNNLLEQIIGSEDLMRLPRLNHLEEKDLLRPVLDNFVINVSNLINFLDLSQGGPDNFVRRSLLRVPETKTHHLMHGTAMHAALEHAQKQVNIGKFNINDAKKSYEQSLKNQLYPPNELDDQVSSAGKTLDKLFNDFDYVLPIGSKPEYKISTQTRAGSLIGGKLDRLDSEDERITIIDYKTGQPLSSFDTKDKNKQIKVWKHKLQLSFYALLAKNTGRFKQYTAIAGQMVYLETDKLDQLILEYTPTDEDLIHLEKLVDIVYRLVTEYKLPDTDKYSPDIDGIRQFIDDLVSKN